LINQLIVLKQSFPSSVTISATVESFLNKLLETLFSIDRNLESINLSDEMVMVKNVALLFVYVLILAITYLSCLLDFCSQRNEAR